MLEIHGQNIASFDLIKTDSNSEILEMDVNEESRQAIKKFPFELVDNNYNVYNLFSPDFSYYLDWCHSTDTLMVIESKSDQIMYRFGQNFL